jgi:hypothetical protein
MKQTPEEGRKIPFFFTPFPNFLFEAENFKNTNLIRFVLWALHRTTFDDMGEFSFGRAQCAKETGISEQRIRTIINQLSNQQLIQKVTSKSTSKFTIYKWLWEHFPGFINHQANQKSTTNQPQTNHYTYIDIYKEQQQQISKTGQDSSEISVGQAAAAFPRLIGKAKRLLSALSDKKRDAAIALFHMRSKSQPIENPDAWFVKCIEEGWLEEEKIEIPCIEEKTISNIERNRAFASELVRKLEGLPGLHICLRNDFLELGDMKSHPWQILFCEASKKFELQVEAALKKLGCREMV